MNKNNPHYFIFEPLTSLNRIASSINAYLSKLVGGDRIINLLLHQPYRIEKANFLPKLSEVRDQELVITSGKIENHLKPNNSRQPYKINCYNPSGYFNLVFFKIFPSQIEKLKIGNEIAILGRISKNLNDNQITHPIEIVDSKHIDQIPKINVIYPLSEKISNKFLTHKIKEILKKLPNSCEEWIDKEFVKKIYLPSFYDALRKIHNPTEDNDLKTYNPNNIARKRLAFDELLSWQLAVLMAKNRAQKNKIFTTTQQNFGEKFITSLPFKPTDGQLKAIEEINNEIFSNKKMIRLLQGDVGSGKTIVAIFSALQNIAQQKQACILVPTTVLATQHFTYFHKLLNDFNLKITLLTSATTKKNKNQIINDLSSGKIDILISTHSCLEDDIIFKNLGIIVIDEQHRFGVLQRLKIVNKGPNADLLLMSATPIPRSLMMGLYGDMDISILSEKPKNRQKIETLIMSMKKSHDLFDAVKRAINKNEKIYWICPAIDENEEQNLISVNQKFLELSQVFGTKNIALLHGKMKDKEKEKIMSDFADDYSDIKILIATTVIEVGIDVPSATVIVIENAEQFGLAQLHQLRGRVGRSEKKSFCILLYGEKYGKKSQQRLSILRESNDGFFIAEEDLKMRGSGEIIGTKQSGFPEFRVADLNFDHSYLGIANKNAQIILNSDPKLELESSRKYKFLLKIFNYDECLSIINSG
ncbi:MAG: ATP-dependent DNA helicase RecG [Proteobacteria bacterium]|jgi:ATP-dependent DNA helicase RecG|nr:ATP-dependent DNA helicase RecG [Pseudomonadota bacterium]NCA28392.1 ATP-dependent DNA helicase RecG [Pseudomonadota bacterium]